MVQNLPTLVFGDPHGSFDSVREFCGYHEKAGTVILLGDQNCEVPLYTELANEIAAGWVIRWITGNHDTDTEEFYSNLSSHDGSLMNHVSLINGLRVAGLAGVFRGRIWNGKSEPYFRTRTEYVRSLKRCERWKRGLPLVHLTTIFPSDFDELSKLRADVLVCHEAPSTHKFGFSVIDELAKAMGVKLIVHGHHHHSYRDLLPSGIHVRGLSVGEPFKLENNFCSA